MRKFLTTAEATADKFLFISYSHDEREVIQEWADYLLNCGVRAWWDKAFNGGDDWETIAQNLLSHENCMGILFFCSKSAIASPNVAKEWRTAAKTKQARPTGEFYPQIIMIGDDTDDTFNYHYLTNFVKKTEELFSDDDYDDFRDLFGKKDHLYYSVSKAEDKQNLFENIKKLVPQTVDEHEIARDKLADLSNLGKEVVLKLGTYNDRPIVWRKIFDNENESTLICDEVLTDSAGGKSAEEWLNNFVKQAFQEGEQRELQGKVRLLTLAEVEGLSKEELSRNKIWWLNDTNGYLQAVVREDGTVYKYGYNNRLYEKGIRPAITLDSVKLFSILNK